MTDAPTPPAATPPVPAPAGTPGWVTVSVTVPEERVADFYKQAAEWIAAYPGPDPGPYDNRGHTRTS